jgi:NitT/TauT family transport system permease protein
MAVTDVDVRDLDALERDTTTRTPWPGRLWSSVWPLALGVAVLIGAWELAYLGHLRQFIPSPVDVWSSLRSMWDRHELLQGLWVSTHRALAGFLVSIAVGTVAGVTLARVRLLRRMFHPILTGLQVLPSVAWVPAAILWFGLGPGAIYFVILLGAIPSIANGTIAGLDQVPPLFSRVGRVLGARGLTLARLVLMPAAVPTYLAGLKQGWAFSWRSLMAAELISQSPRLGTGLGQLLDQGRFLADNAQVVASILLILFVGIVIELGIFAPIERRVLRNRGLAGS